MPELIMGKQGHTIHGIIGFLSIIRNAMRQFQPTNLLILFDSNQPTWRHQLDSNYKANRDNNWDEVEDNENPFSQMDGIIKSLKHLNWQHYVAQGVEADDIIAVYCNQCQDLNEIIVMSGDSDLLQLVNNTTKIWHPRGEHSQLFDDAAVHAKFGVTPSQIPLYKAIVGDSSDNITGIAGVGPKTALKIINEYQNIDEIKNNLWLLPTKLADKVEANLEIITNNLKLITLNYPMELPIPINDLTITPDDWDIFINTTLEDLNIK